MNFVNCVVIAIAQVLNNLACVEVVQHVIVLFANHK